MTTVFTLMLLSLIIVTIKVTKLVWINDKIIPIMLIFLILSILGEIIFFSKGAREARTDVYNENECQGFLISVMPVFFFAMAVSLNLSKWIYFLLRIRTFR